MDKKQCEDMQKALYDWTLDKLKETKTQPAGIVKPELIKELRENVQYLCS